jgi:shikimate kinase
MTATPSRPPRVVLLGMMGSGKSSVGRALSERTGWRFVDNDELVQEATGRTARQLLAERGEAAMRAAESAALHAGVALAPPVIVATAAGTILDPNHRERLRDAGFVVWLHAPAEALAARAVGADHRPWLEEDPVGWFRAALEERAPWYREISDLEIDTASRDPSEAAQTILSVLSDRSGDRLPSGHG